jgi:hypothetical protein
MEGFITRLQIIHYNLKNTKNINKKELILNKLIDILFDLRLTSDILNYMYTIDLCFLEYLKDHNLDYMILLLYDLSMIATEINLDKSYSLTFNNGKFTITMDDVKSNTSSDLTELLPLDVKWGDVGS